MDTQYTLALGIDTGGTFTDFVLIGKDGLQTHKVLSTPDAPQRAILQGIEEMGLGAGISAGKVTIIHGSTVATNAALENKGVRTAFITNKGFRDILTIGRQTRPALYSLEMPPQSKPVPQDLCLEVSGRVDAQGRIIQELAEADLQKLVEALETLRPDAIAITLLFSFLNGEHELRVEHYLRENLSWQPFICRSSFVLPEYREYERGIATWLNASLGPLVKDYLLDLKRGTEPSPLSIMQSTGGTITAEQAADKAVNLLLSGPAGGLAAASWLASSLQISGIITFDMGGTSSDVALLDGGNIHLSSEGRIGPWPVAVPMVDMHTIGAGGGSIAWLDEGGLLRVGPESAGARPGPACYGLGGEQPTVTDANLLLGRLQPASFMGGAIALDEQAAQQAIAKLANKLALTNEECAAGIVKITNEHLAQALRVISVGKGHDPAQFRLCCFGGAGGLHICALAEALGMTQALVPMHAGVLSALGMLLAPIERHLSHNFQELLAKCDENAIQALFADLQEQALSELAVEQTGTDSLASEYHVDVRYHGQSSTLNLPWQDPHNTAEAFHRLHASRYGHRLNAEPELVNLRISIKSTAQRHELPENASGVAAEPQESVSLYGFAEEVTVYQRETLAREQKIDGPALVLEKNATTLIEAEWCAISDRFGNLYLDKQ